MTTLLILGEVRGTTVIMLQFKDIRKGVIIVFEGEPYVVASANFLRKQQRRPVMKTILRSLRTGVTKEHSFQQSDKVPEADVDRREAQFLYVEGDQLHFMDQTSYEQFMVPTNTVAAADLLLEGEIAEVVLFQGVPVTVQLPIKIDRKVVSAPPGIRGDTSSGAMKDVTVEGGVTIKTPLFVITGDMIRIDTRDYTYVERVQK